MDIDAGVPSPLNLVGGPERGALDVTGHIDSLHHCHQVLAYAYEVDSAKNLTLLVYDCNDPLNDNSTLSLNIGRDPAQTIPIAAPAVSAAMLGGIDVCGFFRTDYELRDPSAITGTQWQEIGHANGVVAMAGTEQQAILCHARPQALGEIPRPSRGGRRPTLTRASASTVGHWQCAVCGLAQRTARLVRCSCSEPWINRQASRHIRPAR